MKLLNRKIFKNAFDRYGKRLRVIPILENEARWHLHAAIEPPIHMSFEQFKAEIICCWHKTDWGYQDIVVNKDADERWMNYMLKIWQKPDFEYWSDCIDLESLYNPC